ncbi:hypothetical protein ES703_46328 [subsurface metagenome]
MRTFNSLSPLIVFILVLLSAQQAIAVAYGREVLALYKSSEGQTENENEIFYYLSKPIKEMGLSLTYWDIDRGIPGERLLNRVRAVITWFRGPAMSEPEAYLDFLNKSMDSGCKLVVFDNFGAYQNNRTKEYLPTGRINHTLSRLGILYFGDWTEDGRLIEIVQKDSFIVEQGGPQNPKVSRLFYRFIRVDRNLKVHLSLTRKDRSYDPSPVIVTNKDGGFALSRYIYSTEGGKVLLLLNVEAFLREALFPGPLEEKIALLADASDPTASRILNYTEAVLRRAKLPFEVFYKEQFGRLLPGDLRRFTAAGLILKDDGGLDPAILEDYLQQGGGLVSLQGGDFRLLSPSLALNKKNSGEKSNNGYRFRYGFILGEGLYLEEKDFGWASGTRLPSEDAEVLAYSFTGDSPLLWTAERGRGKILVWNWNGFETGDFQGLLLESFLFVRPVGVAATAGLGLIFIDDWPLPMYNVVKPPLSITDTEFYTGVWWTDIKDLFSERRIPFNSFLIFNYNDLTTPPFTGGEFFIAENLDTMRIGREILESGEELAFHGYNHMSLTLEKTEANLRFWPSRKAMEESLEQAKREWINLFGEHSLPFAYVAPNNIISDEGIEAIHKVFPSIKVISSLRSGLGEETRTEFGAHPKYPDLYYIPRTSCGYPFTPAARQLTAAAVSGAGLWTHFIHPDDVFDQHRSLGLGWKELQSEFEKILDFVRKHYPWLRFVSIRDAYQILQKIDNSEAEFRWNRDKLLIYSSPGQILRIRLNNYKVKKIEGARVIYEYKRMPALILEITAPEAEVIVEKGS